MEQPHDADMGFSLNIDYQGRALYGIRQVTDASTTPFVSAMPAATLLGKGECQPRVEGLGTSNVLTIGSVFRVKRILGLVRTM